MKNGKNPTRRQRRLLETKNLNPADWLVTQDNPDYMEIVRRHSERTRRVIMKERDTDVSKPAGRR